MITPENITRKQAKRLVQYLERWTRCEIMSRYAHFDNLEFGDYALKKIEYEERIRKLLFGNRNAFELGIEWGMIKKVKGKTTVSKRNRSKL